MLMDEVESGEKYAEGPMPESVSTWGANAGKVLYWFLAASRPHRWVMARMLVKHSTLSRGREPGVLGLQCASNEV
jgi:hypothetical protein